MVNRKQVTVGTIGGDYALFSRQPGPTEVEEALYTKVSVRLSTTVFKMDIYYEQNNNFIIFIFSVLKVYSFPDQIIPAVLQQELILYCGKLIATNPELFSGILKVRMR